MIKPRPAGTLTAEYPPSERIFLRGKCAKTFGRRERTNREKRRSENPGLAPLSREGIQKIKFVLSNDIFQQEILHTYEQKSASRGELVRESRRVMKELIRQRDAGQKPSCPVFSVPFRVWVSFDPNPDPNSNLLEK